MRLAVFVDQIFWHDGQHYSTDEAYVLFYQGFVGVCDEVVFISRLAPEPGRKPYVLSDPALRLRPIPFYRRVAELWRAGDSFRSELRALVQREARSWDVLLVCGPHPAGQYLAEQAIAAGVPVALMIRQNLVPQVAFASRGLRRVLGVAYASWLERRFRRLAAGRVVFAVGQEMTDAYSKVTPHAHNHFACLVTDAQFAQFSAMARTPDPRRLLCVGRLSAEKGHRYLLAALARLAAAGVPCSLDIVGTGELDAALRAEAARLGLDALVQFHGYVPYGPELFALYQRATALVVPSLEGEGFPQVINEALCLGLPVIASAVGGIPGLLRHGETALLTGPADPSALVAAIRRLIEDDELRTRLAQQGRELMRANTLEANRDRMLQVLHANLLTAHA